MGLITNNENLEIKDFEGLENFTTTYCLGEIALIMKLTNSL